MAIHFNSTKERLDFLKGKHEEYTPVEYIPVDIKLEKKEDVDLEELVEKVTKEVKAKAKAKSEPKKEAKPKKKTESKDKKK